MATLSELAGTLSHNFNIGGTSGIMISYGKSLPLNSYGNVGDLYIRTTTQLSPDEFYDTYAEMTSVLPEIRQLLAESGKDFFYIRIKHDENYTGTPDTFYKLTATSLDYIGLFGERLGKLYYKTFNGEQEEWKSLGVYHFDEPIIKSVESTTHQGDFEVSLKQSDNGNTDHNVDKTSTKETDYSVNHDNFGVTRYATDEEGVANPISDFTQITNTFDKNTTTHKFEDKLIALTPEQIGKNIKVEMTRAITVEGFLNNLTTSEKTNLVAAINELDGYIGSVTTAMASGTSLAGKTIATGNNTDITVANALSTLNTKAGVLTSLTTDAKTDLVSAINEVDAHTDTNTTNIGTVTTPMATGTSLAGKTIATGNNTDITVANAISTLNTAVKTNKDNIGDLNALTTENKSNLVLAINSEVTRATTEEASLQSQIDAITSKSDVADIVPNYASLTAYDTAPLYDNDVIKVLEDETDNNATTYYRLSHVPTNPDVTVGTKSALPAVTESDDGKIAKVTSDETHSNQTTYYECRKVNGTYEWVYASPSKVEGGSTVIDTSHIWNYIGQEGSYYTKGEADNRFVNVDGDTMTGTLTISSTGSIDASGATSVSVPTLAAGTNTTGAASTAFVKTAIDNEDALVVHLAGVETITGNKTFGSGTTTTVSGSISLGDNATAKTQASNDSSTKVATTAWVNDTNNNVVHKSGAETITGEKTVSGVSFKVTNEDQFKILTYDTRIDRGVAPQSWIGMFPYLLIGKNGKRLSGLYCSYAQNMQNQISLVAYKGTSTDQTDYSIAEIGVGYDSNTKPYAKAPEPDATNSTSLINIATVGWVNDPTKSTNVVHRSGDETIAGTKTFSSNVVVPQTPTANTHATSKKYVDDGLSTKQPTIQFTSSNNGQVLSNNGTALVWKTVRDITTLSGLDDTTISSASTGQSLVYDATAAKWKNENLTVATIKYW